MTSSGCRRVLHALAGWFLCAAAAVAATAGGAPPSFDILEFAVEGNTVLANEAIERAVYPFLGEKRTVDDVESARAALERAYHAAGYGTVGVDIPEQRVAAGVVVLRVVQAGVSRLRVTGSRYFSQGRIMEQVPALAEGAVPNLKEVQEQLSTVNRTADRRVTPLLRPGKAPGTTEVDLTVEDRLPLHGSIELNNKASANSSAMRLAASIRYDNLLQRDHSLGLQWLASPQNRREVQVLSASYTVPLGLDQLSFSLLRSDSESAAGIGDTTVFGKGTVWGVRRSVVVALRDKEYHALSVGAEYKDFDETVDIGSGTGFTTPLHYLPLNAGYTGIVEDGSGKWQLSAGLVVGIRNLASNEPQFRDKRSRGSGGFSVLKLDVSREQALPWGTSLLARLDGQYAGQPLVSNEQFVAGGADSVRGYHESAAVGDMALHGAIEMRSPAWAGLAFHAFAEGAWLELRDPLPSQQYRFTPLGAGFGLRTAANPYGSLRLDLGWALRPVGSTQRGDLRVHAAAAIEF